MIEDIENRNKFDSFYELSGFWKNDRIFFRKAD